MSSLLNEIKQLPVPVHIAIIMDGNGRWAKARNKSRIIGHQNALTAVRNAIEGAGNAGVKYLTLYAFSAENWQRPKLEVRALFELMVRAIHDELDDLHKNGIRLHAIGEIDTLPAEAKRELMYAIERTKHNEALNLIVALSYSSRMEIAKAVRRIAEGIKTGAIEPEEIDESLINQHLETADFPEPELLIRTSGEYRISNFLLWQLCYSELLFIDKFWPDFRKEDLYEAIADFQKRERRFGKTSEQIKT